MPADAAKKIDAGLAIVDRCVRVTAWGFESNSEAVEAAHLFEQAMAEAPDHAEPAYLAAAAYSVGAQFKTSGELLERVRERFPDHRPSRIMHESAQGVFAYPSYRVGDAVPDVIAAQVKANLVVMTRHEGTPVPVLFSRQTSMSGPVGPQTRVAAHPVYVHDQDVPLLVVIAVIADNPADPLRAEFLLVPFAGKGADAHFEPRVRLVFGAATLPLVVIDQDSRVILHREIVLGEHSRAMLAEAEPRYLKTTPRELVQERYVAAVRAYQQSTPIEQFGLC